MSLWISNRGEVACGKDVAHGGAYLVSAIKGLPRHQTQVSTLLDHWMLLPDSVAKEFGLECEGCTHERPSPLPIGVQQAEGG